MFKPCALLISQAIVIVKQHRKPNRLHTALLPPGEQGNGGVLNDGGTQWVRPGFEL